jgi:sulfotransferase
MVSHLHVISGLPRAGSTLLSAILQQNPRFHAGVTSPVLGLCAGMLEKMAPNSEFHSFFDDERRRRLLKGIVRAYYGGAADDRVVFDTNRSWTGKIPLLTAMYPEARLICCVREIGWIIDSIEKALRENPLQHSRIFGYKAGSSVYGRVETLMNSESGLIGLAWSSLMEAWFSREAKRLIVVRYESLTSDPAGVLNRVYAELGEPAFQHDFNDIAYDTTAYDADLGMPGLHRVQASVTASKRAPCIPPDLFAKHANLSFWNKVEVNPGGAIVL